MARVFISKKEPKKLAVLENVDFPWKEVLCGWFDFATKEIVTFSEQELKDSGLVTHLMLATDWGKSDPDKCEWEEIETKDLTSFHKQYIVEILKKAKENKAHQISNNENKNS